jgi:peptide/nickel transport system permease protein
MTGALVFLAHRVGAGLATILAIVTFTFVVFWATPTRPAAIVFPTVPHLTAWHDRQAARILRIDRPKLDIYLGDIPRLFRWRFGHAWAASQVPPLPFREPTINAEIDPELDRTLSLLLGGAAIVLVLAVPLGAFAGRRIGSIGDRTVSLLALVGVCSHPMVIAVLVRSLFHGRLHWAPSSRYCPLIHSGAGCGGPADWAAHLALPWLTFALLFLALYVRMVRASVAETLHEEYVRTARAKGASELRVLARHVLPNAGLRILTMIGMEIGTAIGVCIYVESAFGLGGLATDAVWHMSGSANLDLPIVLALVFVISVIVVVGNLAVDALYVFFDPRLALGGRPRTAKSAAGGVI